jgi:hypothetical protein
MVGELEAIFQTLRDNDLLALLTGPRHRCPGTFAMATRRSLGEPAIDGGQEYARLMLPATIAPEAREAQSFHSTDQIIVLAGQPLSATVRESPHVTSDP